MKTGLPFIKENKNNPKQWQQQCKLEEHTSVNRPTIPRTTNKKNERKRKETNKTIIIITIITAIIIIN